ncbi:arsenate reductase ArsC [Streptomyces narbonensis]|uniref:arsenate reductase ArsC n=1 Tax=Streptomyces narbonensis TaxID=67333 RepID=UPI0016747AE5|nr:arsenate reductase ArsC [Streptomyces narbonensis]GGV97934.1 low molecular weight phosphatase family protein [Streptomyces narbonensis]
MAASSQPVLPDERLAAGVARLAVRHQGRCAVETVQRLVADSYKQLAANAQVRTHLVVLAERFAAERLDALAHVENPVASGGRPRVLFVCSHNAGRSQMAAALLAHRAGDIVTVSSAGTHPAGAVDPHVVQALTEAGVALDDAYPKPLTDEVVQGADTVITMGCGDACPVVPGHRYLDWPVPDPDGAPIAVVRSIRDAIDARITALLDSLPGI